MQLLNSDQSLKIKVLRECRYFNNVNIDILKNLAPFTNLYRYKTGESVCWQGEECAGLYIIQYGSVKLFRVSPKGRELIVNILGKAESFNEVPVFDHQSTPVNVQALETSEIWLVDKDAINRSLSTYPEMAEAIILNLSKNLRMLVNKVEEISFSPVTNRLARLIQQLPSEQLDGIATPLPTQDQIAARLGTVREVVARSLKELERSGAIRMHNRRIYIENEDTLYEWTQ